MARLTDREGRILSNILQRTAEVRGLNWEIAYADAPIEGYPDRREPHAFRLVSENGLSVEPSVIGETLDDALDCVTLSAEMKKDGRRRKT